MKIIISLFLKKDILKELVKRQECQWFFSYKLKENDAIFYFDKINSLSKMLFFTNLGNYFILDAHTIKECGWKDLGTHVSSIVALDNGESIVRIMEVTSFQTYAKLIMITRKGYAKKNEFKWFWR